MKRKLGIFWGLVGAVAVSAMSVSASTFETLPDSGDYEKIVALADEIVSSTNGGPVYDPFSEGVTVDDIDFDNALKEYIDTPLFTSELFRKSKRHWKRVIISGLFRSKLMVICMRRAQ